MSLYMPKGAPPEGQAFAWALPGFDEAGFKASLAGRNVARMQDIYLHYPDDEMNPAVVKYWQSMGVRKELFDQGTEGKYAVYTPLDLEPNDLCALVYVSHGGMEPINRTETNGWPRLAGKEKFICVIAWNGGPSNDEVETEFARILGLVVDNGYPVDLSRVYAVGYSAGSDATGVLACAYPDILAGVSPDPGGNLFAKGRWYSQPQSYSKNDRYPLPIICVGGTMDGGDRYPLASDEAVANFNIWMAHVAHVDDFEPLSLDRSMSLAQSSEDPSKKVFGLDFHKTFQIRMEEVDWMVGDFKAHDTTVARFISGVGLPHTQTWYSAPMIWDFLCHFSRDRSTGASVYAPIAVDGLRSSAS